MVRRSKVSIRKVLIIVHDLAMTAAAVVASLYIRFEDFGFDQRIRTLALMLPFLVAWAGATYWYFDLYRSKWRFASLPDLSNIFRASSVMALSVLALDYVLLTPQLLGSFFFGKITIALYWILQMVFLMGPRAAYRYFRYTRTQIEVRAPDSQPTLVIGRAADAEVLLRSVETGVVKKIRVVGILSPAGSDEGQAVRHVPILGRPTDIEAAIHGLQAAGTRVQRLIVTPTALEAGQHPEAALMYARRFGLPISRMPSLAESGDSFRLAPVDVEDLLLRPSVSIDYQRLENFVRGKSVVVTGGGGSIGSEICDRLVTFGAARVLILESSEAALHAIVERLQAKDAKTQIEGRIADVRERERIFELIGAHRPDLVFHAAALKHVPLLERDWNEGVKTNVFGSVNVADAAVAAKAAAMVMISTDKAIDPVSVLGVTKRFAEMYCHALDGEFSRAGDASRMRLLSVRFGNVLASNGSVVPKFKAQIEAGGPVTVTHPDMVRYFMTIREACDLVITAAGHALGNGASTESIYLLNMGQPVKIVDLAERMIRLAGLEPGKDIDLVFSGVRPGERLHEIMFGQEEPTSDTGIPGVVAARPAPPSLHDLRRQLTALEASVRAGDESAARKVFSELSAGIVVEPAETFARH